MLAPRHRDGTIIKTGKLRRAWDKLQDAEIDMARFCLNAYHTLDLETAIVAAGFRANDIKRLKASYVALGGKTGH